MFRQLTAILLLSMASLGVQAAAFTYTLITDSTGPVANFVLRPAMNDSGTILYGGSLSTETERAYFIQDTNGTRQISYGDPGPSDFFSAYINNYGAVAYYANGTTHYVDPTGATSVITDSTGGFRVHGPMDLNDAGHVVVRGETPGGANGHTIPLVISNEPTQYLSTNLDESQALMNSSGLVLTTGPRHDNIWIHEDGERVGEFNMANLSTFLDLWDLNNAGTYLVGSVYDSRDEFDLEPEYGVLIADNGGTQSVIARCRDWDLSCIGSAAINDTGTVLAEYFHDPIGPGGNLARTKCLTFLAGGSNEDVVCTGDLLDGVAVTGLRLGNDGLNNNGQVAFMADLSDGRQALFVASPVPIPPAAWLFSSALGLLGVVKRWSRGTIQQKP